MISPVLEVSQGVDIVMLQVWRKRSYLRIVQCPPMKNNPLKRRRLFKEKKNKDKKAPENSSKPITKKEASEFLKFIKHSEYSVIKQLNKTPIKTNNMEVWIFTR